MYYVFAWDEPSGGGADDLMFFSDDLSECIEQAIELTSKQRFFQTGHAFQYSHVAGADDAHGLVVEWRNV